MVPRATHIIWYDAINFSMEGGELFNRIQEREGAFTERGNFVDQNLNLLAIWECIRFMRLTGT